MADQEDGPITMIGWLWLEPDGGAELFAEYIATARPILEKHLGQEFVSQYWERTATLGGDLDPDIVAINDFPSEAAFMAAMQDPDYPTHLLEEATTRVEVVQIRKG
ncbi:MAG TPA: DUF1330 domain-containing protein [Ilumatobacteraceae bacterium]|nr:DUF1330 domain-containing protein [Ilumatobacteraceae bacterium]